MVKPLAPADVVSAQVELFPDFVIETWNKAIAKNWSGTQSRIEQDDMVLELIAASPTLIDRGDVFARHWLDIEDVYRAEGWVVEYVRPVYNDSYYAHYIFKKTK
jgi:hypothetical protein